MCDCEDACGCVCHLREQLFSEDQARDVYDDDEVTM